MQMLSLVYILLCPYSYRQSPHPYVSFTFEKLDSLGNFPELLLFAQKSQFVVRDYHLLVSGIPHQF
jgi:hypothetical protein